jgi:hypothetical protein
MSAANGNGWSGVMAAMLPKVPRALLSMLNAKPKPRANSWRCVGSTESGHDRGE